MPIASSLPHDSCMQRPSLETPFSARHATVSRLVDKLQETNASQGGFKWKEKYSVSVEGDLLGEALLCKVADRIVVRIGEEVCQVVALPRIHLQDSPGLTCRSA